MYDPTTPLDPVYSEPPDTERTAFSWDLCPESALAPSSLVVDGVSVDEVVDTGRAPS